jgi:hypothetical protein
VIDAHFTDVDAVLAVFQAHGHTEIGDEDCHTVLRSRPT